MNFQKFNHFRASAFILGFFALIFGVYNASVSAQKVRLRSKFTPNCTQVRATGSGVWKFADIFGDGNIAVQGSYGCNGAFIYDITNPDAPVLANWYNPGNNQQFLEAIVVGNRGYFGSGTGNGGVHIVDLTNPYSPVLLGTVDSTHGNGHNIIHEMMVISQGGKSYLIENYNQLSSSTKIIKIIDVTNPAAPVFKWDLNPTDATWVHAFHVRGNRMYTSGWGGKVEIYDIANLATQAPTLLGAINGNSTNHSTWTSEDGNYLYSCRETLDGDVRVYNVFDPSNPLLIKSIKAADLGLNAITPHNPVVMGNKLYVAWYQAGLQVFDISNPADPKRIGQYDTFQPAFAPTEEERAALANTDPWDMICGMTSFQNALPSSYDGDWAVYPFLGENKVLAGDLTNGLLILDATKATTPLKTNVSDFDGDGKTDFSVYRKVADQNSQWWILKSSDGNYLQVLYGLYNDRPAPADFDGDGKTDIAVFRPSNGKWYIRQSSNGTDSEGYFGISSDLPTPKDFDGDGRADLAVWRASISGFYSQNSSNNQLQTFVFPQTDLKPVPADYDGDGRADFAVRQTNSANWIIRYSSSNQTQTISWQQASDLEVPNDYDGDGLVDIAVWREANGHWYIRKSSQGDAIREESWGAPGDIPVPAFYRR